MNRKGLVDKIYENFWKCAKTTDSSRFFNNDKDDTSLYDVIESFSSNIDVTYLHSVDTSILQGISKILSEIDSVIVSSDSSFMINYGHKHEGPFYIYSKDASADLPFSPDGIDFTSKNQDLYEKIKQYYQGIKNLVMDNQAPSLNKKESIKKDRDEQSINDASKIADKLLQSEKLIENGINAAQNIIKEKGNINSLSIDEQANIFNIRATEHSCVKWLVSSIIFGILTTILSYLLFKDPTKMSELISKLFSLSIPIFFTGFCIKQHLYHKKMYEIYSFKYAALNTMKHLITEKADFQDKILDKGLDVIFSSPTVKETGSTYDKFLLSELISIARSSIEKKKT